MMEFLMKNGRKNSKWVWGSEILEFVGIYTEKLKIFQPGAELVEFFEFVLKNWKFFQHGSEVVVFGVISTKVISTLTTHPHVMF